MAYPSTQPLSNVEIRALRKLKKESIESPYVFTTERKSPFNTRSVHDVIRKSGELANLDFPIHAHMLRHSTGFYLANKGFDTRAIQSYMGHADIRSTVIYTELAPNRFNNFWDD